MNEYFNTLIIVLKTNDYRLDSETDEIFNNLKKWNRED